MSELVPCPGCRRHVRVRETSCPFCAGALSEQAARGPVLKPGGRMSRAALVAAGAALLGAAACDENVAVPVYGAPAPDGATAAADAGADSADANQGNDANGISDAFILDLNALDVNAPGDANISEAGTVIYGSAPRPEE